MFQASRKNDALLTICQHNGHHTLEVCDANAYSSDLLGFSQEELLTKSFFDIVSADIQETITDYLEFGIGGNDVANILRKVRTCHMCHKDGSYVPIRLKVFPNVSQGEAPCFTLLMRDNTLLEKLEELRIRMAEERQNQELDAATGLPNRNEMVRVVELFHEFVEEYDKINASLAIIQLDESYHKDVSFISQVGEAFQTICREDDTIGYLGGGTLCVVLYDCSAEHTQGVLSRIKKAIQDIKQEVLVNIGYSAITAESDPQTLIDQCIILARKEHGGIKRGN